MTRPQKAAKEIRRIVEDAGTSFYWAMRLLPADRREAMFAVYAFCREVDDVADGDLPLGEKRKALDEWRAEIARIFDGNPQSSVGKALAVAAREYGLDRGVMEAIVAGVEMDATGEAMAPDMDTLITYCNRVASAVGLLSIKIFGDDSKEARRGAVSLGHALQLTNILRDVADDAAQGRLYLPRELLEDYGIDSANPTAVMANPALASVCRDIAEVAASRFAAARESFAKCDRKALRPAFAMMNVYELLLKRMQSRGWTRLDKRPRIGPLAKLWIALKHMM